MAKPSDEIQDPASLPLTNSLIKAAFEEEPGAWYKATLGVEAPTIGEELGFPGARSGRFSRSDSLRDMVRSHVLKSRLDTQLAREAGPTQGQLAAMPGGEALLGVSRDPMGREALQPSTTHPGLMQLFQPNEPLNPAQSAAAQPILARDPLATQLKRTAEQRAQAEEGRKAELHPLAIEKAQEEVDIAHIEKRARPDILSGRIKAGAALAESRASGAELKDEDTRSKIALRTARIASMGTRDELAGMQFQNTKDASDFGNAMKYIKYAKWRLENGDWDSRDEMEELLSSMDEAIGMATKVKERTLDVGQKKRAFEGRTALGGAAKPSAFADAPPGKNKGAVLKENGKPVATWDGTKWVSIQ